MNLKDKIAQAGAMKIHEIEIDGVEGGVYCREINGEDFDYMQRASGDPMAQMRALIVRSVCDDEGVRVYADGEESAVSSLTLGMQKQLGESILAALGMDAESAEKK